MRPSTMRSSFVTTIRTRWSWARRWESGSVLPFAVGTRSLGNGFFYIEYIYIANPRIGLDNRDSVQIKGFWFFHGALKCLVTPFQAFAKAWQSVIKHFAALLKKGSRTREGWTTKKAKNPVKNDFKWFQIVV